MLFRDSVKKKREKDFNQEINLAIALELERFSEAISEHLRSIPELREISKSKVNPAYAKQNKHQQAGFAAEVKHRARVNADRILRGESGRIELTDNVGETNHPKYDHVEVDSSGQPIRKPNGDLAGGSQHKVFGTIDSYDKLHGREFDHYRDTPIDVPSNQYEKIIARWNEQIQELEQQETRLMKNGNREEANARRDKINKINDAKSRLRKSTVSQPDAMEAREHHNISTMKDTLKLSHKAGLEGAKMGASLGAGISGIRNSIAVAKGDKDIVKATVDVAKDTGKSAVSSYASSAASSIVGGALKASNKQILNNLSKKNGPAVIVRTGVILTKNMTKLVSGKITGTEFAESISKEGMTLASSITGANLGAVVGTAIVPGIGTVVGGLVGGMVASMLSSSLYNELKSSLQETRLSEERRRVMETICEKLVEEERIYRESMIQSFEQFYDQKELQLREGLTSMLNAIQQGGSIQPGLAQFGQAFEKDLAFTSLDDFKQHWADGRTLRL